MAATVQVLGNQRVEQTVGVCQMLVDQDVPLAKPYSSMECEDCRNNAFAVVVQDKAIHTVCTKCGKTYKLYVLLGQTYKE